MAQYKFSPHTIILIFILYGLFSSSTPDNISYVEIIIGLLLVLLVGLDGFSELFKNSNFNKQIVSIPNVVKISFFYLFFFPTFFGLLIKENDLGNWLRDIIPLLYIFLPIFLIKQINVIPKKLFISILISISIVGVLFSLRFYIGATGSIKDIGQILIIPSNRDNIIQDPAVQFFLSFTSCASVWFLLEKKFLISFAIFLLSFLPWSVTLASISRGPIALTFLSIIILILYYFFKIKNKSSTILVLILIITILITFLENNSFNVIRNSLRLLIEKNYEFGFSTRDLELYVVINSINFSLTNFFFGHGWGSLIEVSNSIILRNLHNIFLYFIYKTGIFGFISILIYFLWIIRLVFLIKFQNKIITLILISLLNPILYTSQLQPMYKSLTFGTLILLIPLMYNLKNDDNL